MTIGKALPPPTRDLAQHPSKLPKIKVISQTSFSWTKEARDAQN